MEVLSFSKTYAESMLHELLKNKGKQLYWAQEEANQWILVLI